MKIKAGGGGGGVGCGRGYPARPAGGPGGVL